MLFRSLIAVSLTALTLAQDLARVVTSCATPNTAALTFDDGPYEYIYDISKALLAANATGTFFFNGNNYRCIYDPDEMKRVTYAYNEKHQIGSHTWGHKDLSTLSRDQLHDEMWRVEQALQRIIGVTPAFMRPPYGSYNDLVRQVARERGQVLALWDLDSGDSVGATPEQSKAEYDKMIARKPKTINALNHETYETTAKQVVPYAIQKLQAAGYKLVTLSECTGIPAYQKIEAPGTPDPSWKC